MTPEALAEAIRSGDADRVVKVLAEATEADRAAATPDVKGWQDALKASGYEGQVGGVSWQAVHATLTYAQMGCYGLAEARAHTWALPDDLGRMGQVLADRRPPWLATWAAWAISERPLWWRLLYRLVREGLIPPMEGPEWTLGLMATPMREPAIDLLRAHPELLDREVWHLFEVEGGGEISLAAIDKYGGSWAEALRTLAAEGALDRGRLLDASLEALGRDFEQFRAGWFSRFHESLAPTPAERADRIEHYLRLVGSRIGPTVSFAVRAAAAVEKAGLAVPGLLVAHLSPALAAREKGTALGALKLLDRAARSDPSVAGEVAQIAGEALFHAAPEVQSTAVALIARCGDPSDGALRRSLEERRGDIAATVRPALDAWLGATPAAEGVAPPAAALSKSDLDARAAAVSEPWRSLAGIDAALAAAREGALPPALDLADPQVPRLFTANEVRPIATLDELVDVFAAVLENAGPPDEIERVLDGVSRLCAERPDDFARRTAPLLQRARKLWDDDYPTYQGWLPQDLAALAIAWLSGAAPRVGPRGRVRLNSFFGGRVREVAQCAAAGRPGRLHATPTHRGGWIDPRVAVERLRQQTAPAPFDAVQALLRLAPDYRAEALAALPEGTGEFTIALCFALGGKDSAPPGGPLGMVGGVGVLTGSPEEEVSLAIRVAACRARDPRGDFSAIQPQADAVGPDGFVPARHWLTTKRETYKDRGRTYHHIRPQWHVEPRMPPRPRPLFPTVLHYEKPQFGEDEQGPTTCWPRGQHAWFAAGIARLADNIDWWEARWSDRVYLEPLLDPDTELGHAGRALLALGLGAKEAGQAGLAVDALIAAIDDGRLCAATLGGALAEAAGTGLIKPTRWAKTLAEAARASVLHGEVIRGALERLVAAAPVWRPADLGPILELWAELCAAGGAGVDDAAARAHLESLEGGGKAVKSARLLLGRPNLRAGTREAGTLALLRRVERAERWQAR